MNFTEEQHRIFEFVGSGTAHGIIDAVAGAGKTTTIMECAKHVGADKQMLFCAFNKAIAGEIRGKFSKSNAKNVRTETIHALGYSILKTNLGRESKIEINDGKYRDMLKVPKLQENIKAFKDIIIEKNGFDPNDTEEEIVNYALKSLLYRIDTKLLDMLQKGRSTLVGLELNSFKEMVAHYGIFTPIEMGASLFDMELEAYHEIYKLMLYEGCQLVKDYRICDFTDMLYIPFELELFPSDRYDFIFIDECQDLSKSQLDIILKFGHRNTRILSVGDPYQSIYGFAGADIQSFERIKTKTKATSLPLTQCFRCPDSVIALAQQIRIDITGTGRTDGFTQIMDRSKVCEVATAGDLIICRIKAPMTELILELLTGGRKLNLHANDVDAFIYEISDIFKPHKGTNPIKAFMLNVEPNMAAAFKRISYRISKELERISDEAARKYFEESEFRALKAKIDFVSGRLAEWGPNLRTIDDFLKRLRAMISSKEDSIQISTIHSAKGLEQNRVFIIDYDRLPLTRDGQKQWEKTQEEHLQYVAITRAKKELYLVQSSSPKSNRTIPVSLDNEFYLSLR